MFVCGDVHVWGCVCWREDGCVGVRMDMSTYVCGCVGVRVCAWMND